MAKARTSKATIPEKKSKHDEIVEAATTAIDEVFSDTSVSQSQTIESLEGLVTEIREKIRMIRADMDR